MSTAKFGKLEYDAGQTLFSNTEATDSGDHTIFTVSGKQIFSGLDGYELEVKPDGIVTGLNLISAGASNNTVSVAGCTCYLAGTLTTIAADTVTVTRPETDVASIASITVNSAGVLTAVHGTAGTTAVFSEERNVAGGPPYIPVGSVELGQVRINTAAAALITADQIYQVIGTHTEKYDSPMWNINNIGLGDAATVSAKKYAHIEFSTPIGEAIHAGGTYRKVYVSGYTPIFSEIPNASNFVPAQNTHSVSSKQVYNGTIGSVASSLGQGSFSADLPNGISDPLMMAQDENHTFRFKPNRNKAPYSLTQGMLGIAPTYPADSSIVAACTISAEVKTANFSS